MLKRGSISFNSHLPTLGFEIQFIILSQIPPNQLFTLRRVSRAWNHMLTNPHLLEEINNRLPYLTSAPDLTSRMKRRMRMIRRQPVWIKPITEAFPRLENHRTAWGFDVDDLRWVRFWNDFVVFVEPPRDLNWNGLKIRDVAIKFKIEGLGAKTRRDFPAVEVNVLEDFKKTCPSTYSRYFEYDHQLGKDLMAVQMRLHLRQFSIQDGKVVVFLEGGQLITQANTPPDLCSIFFIYSIPTGSLIQHTCRPLMTETNGSVEQLIHCRASKTHFLTLSTVYQDGTHDETSEAYWAFLYSLHDGSLVQQILIDGLSPNHKLGDERFQFDHLGRIWFPDARQEPWPCMVSYFGTGQITGHHDIGKPGCISATAPELVFSINDLPRITCGSMVWTIVPTVPSGLKRETAFKVNPHTITVNHARNHVFCSYGNIGIHSGRLCTFHIQTEWLPRPPTPLNPRPDQLTRVNYHTLRTINSFDRNHQHVNTDFSPRIETRTYIVENLDPDYHPQPVLWGFFGTQRYFESSELDLGPIVCGARINPEALVRFHVLPLHDNDVYYPDGLQRQTLNTDSQRQGRSAGMRTNHGSVALQASAGTVIKPNSVPESKKYRLECQYADDGLVWWVGRNWTNGVIEKVWLVCYEEAWGDVADH